jgi:glycosyltransferase 2 family protein
VTQPENSAPAPDAARSLLKIVASLLVTAAFVWSFRKAGLPLLPAKEQFATIPVWLIPAYSAIIVAVHWCRAHRWIYLVRPLDVNQTLKTNYIVGVSLVGYAVTLAAPFRLGEFVRPLLISRTKALGFVQAVGTIVTERIVDGLGFCVLAFVAINVAPPAEPLPTRLGELPLPAATAIAAVRIGPIIFGGALLAMAVFNLARPLVNRLLRRVMGPIAPSLATAAVKLVDRLALGFGSLRSAFTLGFVFDNLASWGLLVLAQWLLLMGVDLEMGVAECTVMIGLLSLGVLLPAGPGLFGAFQLASYVGLALYLPQELLANKGALVVFLAYVIQVSLQFTTGALGFWLMRRAH